MMIMYYNKNAFREVGLDPEKAPATWTELQDAGLKLTKKDAAGAVVRYGIEIPSTQPDAYWPLQALVTQAGGVMNSDDGTKTFFDSPQHQKALEYWVKLTDTGAMAKGILQWATTPSNFLAEKTAIMWHTTGNLVRVKNEAKFDVGVAMLPADVRRGAPIGGDDFHIFKAAPAEQKQAAWTFVKWMLSPERTAEFSQKTGYIAVVKRPTAPQRWCSISRTIHRPPSLAINWHTPPRSLRLTRTRACTKPSWMASRLRSLGRLRHQRRSRQRKRRRSGSSGRSASNSFIKPGALG